MMAEKSLFQVEWQWNGGHVPSEIFGDSLALYVDMMYGKYAEKAVEITKAAPTGQTERSGNGSDRNGYFRLGKL